MIKNKTICIDLDSTIINTSKSIINLHNKLYPHNKIIYIENHDWNFYSMIKTKEQLKELFELFNNKDFYGETLEVFPHAIEYINKLSKYNVVKIVTKHCESRKPITEEWIDKAFPNVELIFVDNFEDKGNIKCDIIIDDKIESLNSFKDDNTVKLLYGNYDWNKNDNESYRVVDWVYIENFIECFNEIQEEENE